MKQCFFSRFFALVLGAALCLAPFPAGASADCFLIDVDSLDMNSMRSNDYIAQHLSSQASGLRVQKFISTSNELAARVRLTLTQMETGTLVFDKNYGYQSGTFDSGEIYLPYGENRTIPYLVTLYIEDWIYAMPFMQLTPRLFYNGACTYGVRMRDYDSSLTSNWYMGTMLDLNALRPQGSQSIPIYASNAFVVGEATVSLLGEELAVFLNFDPAANVEVHQVSIYCVPQVGELTSADPPYINQRSYFPGESISVASLSNVLLYVPMSISYDSAGLAQMGYDLINDPVLSWQLSLWQENLRQAFPSLAEETSTPPEFSFPTDPPFFPEEPSIVPTPPLELPPEEEYETPLGFSPEDHAGLAVDSQFPEPLWEFLPEENAQGSPSISILP